MVKSIEMVATIWIELKLIDPLNKRCECLIHVIFIHGDLDGAGVVQEKFEKEEYVSYA